MRIDVEKTKDSLKKLHGIEPFNDVMTFFYDESGNCRKFSLTEKGVNSQNALWGDFVLAGVAYDGTENDLDIYGLHQALDFKEGQKELKFKHLYHNSQDFCTFMKSQRLTAFLQWLQNSGLFIHYSALNNLFYSLVDIIDSLWEDFPQCIFYFWDIKNALYDFAVEHCNEIINILFRYNYPNVTQCDAFCSELCDLITCYNDDSEYYPGFFLELFRQMLKAAGKKGELVFVQNNEPYILINEYYIFYLERCEVFSKSKHFFDEEYTVQKQLHNIQLYENGCPINNFFFEKSHENIYIQISDMVAGLLRNMFMFLDRLTMADAINLREKLSEKQRQNFNRILKLIKKSDQKSQLLIKNANTPKNINDRIHKLFILSGAETILSDDACN